MPGVSAAFAALLSSPPGEDPARFAAIAEAILPVENGALLPAPARDVFLQRALDHAEAAIAKAVSARLASTPSTRLLARALSLGAVVMPSAQRSRALESLYALDRREGRPGDDVAVSARLQEAATALCAAALSAELLRRDDRPEASVIDLAVADGHDAAVGAVVAAADEVSRAMRALAFRVGFEEICGESLGVLLEQGRDIDFLFAFGACAGIDPATARRVLADPSVEALAIAAAAAGLSRAAFARIAFCLQTSDAGKVRAVEVLDRYRAIPGVPARAVADLWTRARLRPARGHPECFSGADMAMAAG